MHGDAILVECLGGEPDKMAQEKAIRDTAAGREY